MDSEEKNKRIVRIEGDGFPGSTKVFIGDIDISKFISQIKIEIDINAGRAPAIHFTYYGLVELPTELEALVTIRKTKSKLEGRNDGQQKSEE